MKTLYLLRHAKSDWGSPQLSDHERRLNARGRKAAAAMGQYFADEGIAPAKVLVSTAERTRETWARLSSAAGGLAEPVFEQALYLAPPSVYLRLASGLPASCDSALFLAHSPGVEELARWLAASGDEADLAVLRQKYPTGALAEISFDGGWDDLASSSGKARLVRFVRPRMLTG